MTTESSSSNPARSSAREDLATIVKDAWQATAYLADEVQQDTREAAFRLVLEAMLREPVRSTNGKSSQTSSDANSRVDLDELYPTPELRGDAISYYLDIDRDSVEQLYTLDEEPELQCSGQYLSQQNATATKEIALLVLAGRTAIGLDTSSGDIRSVVDKYRKLDKSSFISTLQNNAEFVVLGQPRTGQRTVRLRRAGVDAAKALAQKIINE